MTNVTNSIISTPANNTNSASLGSASQSTSVTPAGSGMEGLASLLAQLQDLIETILQRQSGGPASGPDCGCTTQTTSQPDMASFMDNLMSELDQVATNMGASDTNGGPILASNSAPASISLLDAPLSQGAPAIRLDLGGN